MSSHECILCGKDPPLWYRYNFLPQPPQDAPHKPNVICEDCQAGIVAEATRQVCAKLAAKYELPTAPIAPSPLSAVLGRSAAQRQAANKDPTFIEKVQAANNKSYAGVVCRGAWALGTACGKCERCRDTWPMDYQEPK